MRLSISARVWPRSDHGRQFVAVSNVLGSMARRLDPAEPSSPHAAAEEDVYGAAASALLSPCAHSRKPTAAPDQDDTDRSSERKRRRASNKHKMLQLMQQVRTPCACVTACACTCGRG